VRFLFTTLQDLESDFYGRVGRELTSRGHEVTHLTYSRTAAAELAAQGFWARCLPDVAAEAGTPADVQAEVERIERTYDIPTIRDVYRTDPPCAERDEQWGIERAVAHVRALERVYDELRPDVVVPEVGSELIRTAAHLVGVKRGVPVFFLFYTIFPKPLRLFLNTVHAPIVPRGEVRALSDDERREVEEFIEQLTARGKPILPYRQSSFGIWSLDGVRLWARQVEIQRRDGDNDYMRPWRWAVNRRKERARGLAARALYQRARPGRKTVYFPIHVTDDFKVKRVIPHCVDQASLIEQIAEALPPGYDLVLKEHPVSIGRNRLSMLRRLRRIENVRIVNPYVSSHDLIRDSEAVMVISSTVGLEALLHGKPVLTLGLPFYSGYGVTVDVDSFREIREKVPAVLEFRPDREQILRFIHAAMRRGYPGAPVSVDSSDENARTLAASLDEAAAALPGTEHGAPAALGTPA
jgi:hypothetical protein